MKKYNTLVKDLQKINSYNFSKQRLENTSLSSFIKYKYLIHKKKYIQRKLHNIEVEKRAADLIYDVNVKNWYDNQHISCRKYCKLQENAEFKKNKTLYKLGFSNIKPLHPSIKKIKNLLFQNRYFLKFKNKYNLLISHTLPKKINTISVKAASTTIKLLHGFKSDLYYFTNQLKNKQSLLYFKNVLNQANAQLQKNSSATKSYSDEAAKKFRESIKFTPTASSIHSSSSPLENSMRSKKITHTRTNRKCSADITI